MRTILQAVVPAVLAAAFLAGCATTGGPAAGGGITPFPEPAPPKEGDIYHVPTGIKLSFEEAMDLISAARIVYVGEMHVNLRAHEVQRRIIEDLERRFPGRVAVGMEMFREPQQPSLDRWSRGELSELEFLKESKWYENWGSDFEHYRGILSLARERRMDVVALNPSRELQRKFAAAAKEPLPPELAAQLPETDFSDPLQRSMLQAIFAGHEAGPNVFDSFYRTQVLWEETMASRVVDYLRSPRGEGKRMVVLAGGWHVRYGLGVPRKALRRAALPYVIVQPTEIAIPEEKEEELRMEVDLPEIPLLPADFVWLVDFEEVKSQRARMGVMMRTEGDRVLVEKVVPGSPAEKAGIAAGDELRSLDGAPVTSMGDVITTVNEKKPGDTVVVVVGRGGETLTFTPVLAIPPDHPLVKP